MPDYYAEDAMVMELAANVKSQITAASLATYKRIVDAQIDAELSTQFENWFDVLADPAGVPEQIIVLASLLTAAQLESVKYSINEAGGASPNPYALSLEQKGLMLMASIKSGQTIIPGLSRYEPVALSKGAGSGTFEPVGGLVTQESDFNPFGNRF